MFHWMGWIVEPEAGHEIRVRQTDERHAGKSLINLQTKVNRAKGMGAL